MAATIHSDNCDCLNVLMSACPELYMQPIGGYPTAWHCAAATGVLGPLQLLLRNLPHDRCLDASPESNGAHHPRDCLLITGLGQDRNDLYVPQPVLQYNDRPVYVGHGAGKYVYLYNAPEGEKSQHRPGYCLSGYLGDGAPEQRLALEAVLNKGNGVSVNGRRQRRRTTAWLTALHKWKQHRLSRSDPKKATAKTKKKKTKKKAKKMKKTKGEKNKEQGSPWSPRNGKKALPPLYLSLPLSISLPPPPPPLSLSLPRPLSLPLSLCPFLSITIPLSLSLSLCLCVSLFVSLPLHLHLSLSLCLSLFASFLSLALHHPLSIPPPPSLPPLSLSVFVFLLRKSQGQCVIWMQECVSLSRLCCKCAALLCMVPSQVV